VSNSAIYGWLGAFQFLGSTALGGSMTHWQGGSRTRCEQKLALKLKYTPDGCIQCLVVLSIDGILVTSKLRGFTRVPGLRIEEWNTL